MSFSESVQIPDRIRPLLGIRQFMTNDEGVLMSPNRAGIYWNLDWKTAECERFTGSRRKVCTHTSPDMRSENACTTCGIYLAYDYESLMTHPTPTLNEVGALRDVVVPGAGWKRTVYGLVAARGDVVKGDTIMRVQEARIVAFATIPHKARGTLEVEKLMDLASYFDIPLEVIDKEPNIERRIKAYTKLASLYDCDYDHSYLVHQRR